MIKKIISLCFIGVLVISIYIFYNSQKTFEAVFKNVDGLPKGAPVTALGVKIGEVVRAKPIKDGIKVTVRITRKSFPRPEAGSQLTITSFRPGQGRVLEIIPPEKKLVENKAWIVQEPITAESWLYASIDILNGLEKFSQSAIKTVTPENFDKARGLLSGASKNLNNTANHLAKYEENLVSLEKNVSSRSAEGEALLKRIQRSLGGITRNLKSIDNEANVKERFSAFSEKLVSVGEHMKDEKLSDDLKECKNTVQEYLVDVNESLIDESKKIADSEFKNNHHDFNRALVKGNAALDKVNLDEEKRNRIKTAAAQLKEITTEAAKATQN